MSMGSGSSSGALLAQTLATQLNPVGVVNDPIEDGVGQRWVSHDLVTSDPLEADW
jgi:hypothetical protein